MEQKHLKTILINWIVLLAATLAAVMVTRYVNSLAGWMAASVLGVGFLVALVSYFQGRLEERERLEKLEFDELNKAKSSEALFKGESESFPAKRSREQFEKFLVPGFTVLLFLLQSGAVYLHWQFLEKIQTPLVSARSLVAASLFGLLFLILFLLGKYTAGIARLAKDRLLRPAAGYLLLGAYTSLVLAATVAISAWANLPDADRYVARVLSVMLGLIAAETLIGLLLEIYRPRVKGQAPRVLYDSRLVGLLGEPEGVVKAAAHALDYQFGFKVSDTWFYRFLEKSFAWIVLTQLGVLLLSTCIVFVESGEEALLERFGKPVKDREVLKAGLHLTLPFPIDRVHRYRTDQIQSFVIGVEKDDKHEAEKTIVWSVSHEKEENFIVASHVEASTAGEEGEKKSPPVNLLAVSIPVQFQVTNLTAWAYNNEEPGELLQKLATSEVIRHLVSADINEIMSSTRAQAAQALQARIQEAADQRELGARIVFVGLQDIHPPVAVAEAYEKVVGAIQSREAKILQAQAFQIETNALARAEAFKRLRAAEAEQQRLEVSALARAASFTNQIPAFAAAPSVYAQRGYLQTLARASKDSRKYVLATTNTQDVIIFNLEDKLRPDLLDISVPTSR